MVFLTQTVHLSCVQIWHYLQTDLNELSLEPRHLGVPSGASKTISKPMTRLMQTVKLSCTDTNTISKQKEVRFHMTHVTYEFHRVRPKRCLRLWSIRHKTVHISCVKISTISKRTKTSFHLSLVTLDNHRVRPKQFLSRWHVWPKLYMYLAPTLT